MREVELGRGMVALVDDEDFERLSSRTWRAQWSEKARCWYANDSDGQAMHREILELKKGDPRQGDHLEPEDTLNNQKFNLRIATCAENQANRRKNRNNTSGFKGVSWNRSKGMFQAVIGVGGKNLFLGRRDTAESAWSELYVPAALKHHGDFARVS